MATKEFKGVKMIAFRTKDSENDIWCEYAFLFQSRDDVNSFFVKDNSILLDVFTEEDSRVLNEFEIYNDNPAGHITGISFSTKYAGEVRLYEMHEGLVIQPNKTK